MPNITSVNFPKSGKCHCKEKMLGNIFRRSSGLPAQWKLQWFLYPKEATLLYCEMKSFPTGVIVSSAFIFPVVSRETAYSYQFRPFPTGTPQQSYIWPATSHHLHTQQEETSLKHKSWLLTSTGCMAILSQIFQKIPGSAPSKDCKKCHHVSSSSVHPAHSEHIQGYPWDLQGKQKPLILGYNPTSQVSQTALIARISGTTY